MAPRLQRFGVAVNVLGGVAEHAVAIARRRVMEHAATLTSDIRQRRVDDSRRVGRQRRLVLQTLSGAVHFRTSVTLTLTLTNSNPNPNPS